MPLAPGSESLLICLMVIVLRLTVPAGGGSRLKHGAETFQPYGERLLPLIWNQSTPSA